MEKYSIKTFFIHLSSQKLEDKDMKKVYRVYEDALKSNSEEIKGKKGLNISS
ncbi:MAG TPA: hypothetical protein PLX23_06155 [Candidatus Hydrogenedens sp.]|nr:hypothetical protein [Candidatus Hydrogenedens sp.]